MDLEVADRLAAFFDDPRLDVLTRQPFFQLGDGEGLVVPVARDLGVRMPGDQALDVAGVGVGRPQRCQSSAYEKVQRTFTTSVAPPASR